MIISNSSITCEIDLKGAQVKSLTHVKDMESIIFHNTDIWYGCAPILFPFIGRTQKQCYTYLDTNYPVEIHGFAKNENFKCLSKSENSVTLYLNNTKETFEIFPFEFYFEITYFLIGETLNVSAKISNLSESLLPYQYGHHPAFVVSEGATITLYGDYPLRSYSNIGGYITTNSKFFEKQIEINDSRIDDSLILEGVKTATIEDSSRGTTVEISMNAFNYCCIWGKKYDNKERAFVCVEPWSGLPDTDIGSDIFNRIGTRILKQGETQTFIHTIKVKKS